MAIDVIGYAAQLGAHIVKVKLPTDHIEQGAARKVYEGAGVPVGTAAEASSTRSSARSPAGAS